MSIVSIIKVFIFLLHTSLIAYLVFKLRDIKLRPRLYNTPKNYDRYKKSIWYWPEKADCPKNSPPDKVGQTVCYYFIVLGILLFVPSILYEQADIFKGKYIDCFYSDWWIASFILSFIFSFIFYFIFNFVFYFVCCVFITYAISIFFFWFNSFYC